MAAAARQIGDFHLTDDTGQPLHPARSAGHPTLVFFGFTHCPDVCPTTLLKLAQVKKRRRLPDLRVIFVTVDPERDTPAVLASLRACLRS